MAALRHLLCCALLLACGMANQAHGSVERCGKLGLDLCAACDKPESMGDRVILKACKKCVEFERDDADMPLYPVRKSKSGKCSACTKCPYAEGWESCNENGSCKGCRDGFKLKRGKCVERPPCKNQVECLVRPCEVHFCPATHQCVDDYCGGCNARCVKKDEECNGPMVQCFKQPCAGQTCPDGYKCQDDYCGGCNARCVYDFKTCKDPVNCLVAPCMTAKCSKGHRCVNDYCGGCFARCVVDPFQT